jgi:glycosyltransferase involved in cell wall biosynthesis
MEAAHVREAYDALGDLDLVHDHSILGPAYAATWLPRLPVVTTNHGPFDAAMLAHFGSLPPQVPIVAISHAQRRSAPSVPIAAVIHHGVEVDRFPLGRGDGGYLLFLGRMSRDKGVHRAIAVARAAGRPLRIAAKMWEPAEHRYFAEEVEPLLGDDVVYLGEVGGAAKLQLLAGAEALVNPIRWPEPFGLVMIEALACGTPVLAFPEGAAAEIVEHGRTGFLCRDEADMAERVVDARRLDRAACRARVAERFSVERFVEGHLSLYRQLLATRAGLVG